MKSTKQQMLPALGIIAAVILVSAIAPMAYAQEVDSDTKKYKGNKYNGICDKQKPIVKIATPKAGTKYYKGDTLTVTGIATDKQTGIKYVKVSYDANGVIISTHDGPFTFSAPIVKTGHFLITVKTKDNAGNLKTIYIPIHVVVK